MQTSEAGFFYLSVFQCVAIFLKNNSSKYLTSIYLCCIFVSSIQLKRNDMTYATEFFAVQNALGIENVKSVSNAPFAAIDAQYKSEGRLQDAEKQVEGFGRLRAIFVDGKMVVCELNGSAVDADPQEVREILGL